ncbi:ABC transporter permease [Cellulomonas hominis]
MAATSARVLTRLTVTEARITGRDPASVFFGLAFPTVLLVVLGLVMPWADEPYDATDPALAGFTVITGYTPVVLALAIATVTLSMFPAVIAAYRANGVLRRLSTTPLPASRVLVAQILVHVAMLVAGSVVAVVLARVVLGITGPRDPLVVLLAFLLGAGASIAVGCLIAAWAPTTTAATGVSMLVYFVSMFLAGVWTPGPIMPAAVQAVAAWTPVGAASQAMTAGWLGQGFPAQQLLAMLLWTVVLVPLAARLFRWR